MHQTFTFEDGLICRRVAINGAEFQSEVRNIADDDLTPESSWWQSVLRGERVQFARSGKAFTIVDAFCGSGGLGLGASMAAEAINRKAKFAAIIDTDEDATKVHEHNLGPSKRLAQSVTGLVDYHVRGTTNAASFSYPPEVISDALATISDVDLFIAGPPCQGHSNLNNHTRRQDPRNELYITTIALGVALGAKAFLIENVPTVQNSHADVVTTALSLLRSEGYGISTANLKADELGSAQRRSRFFILAVKNASLAPAFLTDCTQALRGPAQPISWAMGDLLDIEPLSIWDAPPELTVANQKRVDFLFDNDLFDLPDAQRPDCHKNGTTYTAVYGRMHWDRPSQTVTTGIGTPGQGRYIHPLQRRVITPHEAARIQGFPEWFEFAAPQISLKRKNLAKWIGDAVHPILGYAATLSAIQALVSVEVEVSKAAA